MAYTGIKIEEIRGKLEQKNSKVEVEENDQEIIEHNKNKQGQSEEQWEQEILVEQGRKHTTFVHFQKMMKYY